MFITKKGYNLRRGDQSDAFLKSREVTVAEKPTNESVKEQHNVVLPTEKAVVMTEDAEAEEKPKKRVNKKASETEE